MGTPAYANNMIDPLLAPCQVFVLREPIALLGEAMLERWWWGWVFASTPVESDRRSEFGGVEVEHA